MEGWDPSTKSRLTRIQLLATKAGPREGEAWKAKLKEEYKSLIAYTQMNKSNDNDWFRISASNPEGTRWAGKCWYVLNLLRYEFDLQFDIPVTYPATAPELELPQIDGSDSALSNTSLSFFFSRCIEVARYASLCISSRSGPKTRHSPLSLLFCSPRFGIAPWLAAEIPILVDSGMIKHKDDPASSLHS